MANLFDSNGKYLANTQSYGGTTFFRNKNGTLVGSSKAFGNSVLFQNKSGQYQGCLRANEQTGAQFEDSQGRILGFLQNTRSGSAVFDGQMRLIVRFDKESGRIFTNQNSVLATWR